MASFRIGPIVFPTVGDDEIATLLEAASEEGGAPAYSSLYALLDPTVVDDPAELMDELIRHVAGKVSGDTLIMYAADHSFDLRLRGGKKNSPLAPQIAATLNAPPPNKPVIAVENSHTGEDILVAARGPGADRVRGFLPNTRLFNIMLEAYGWKESP